MDDVFRSYLSPGFRYVFAQSPARVRDRQHALRDGLNCVALAHLVIRDLFGHALPAGFQSVELFRDRDHFEPVPATAPLRPGDLVWLGADNPRVRPEDFVPRFRDGELLNFADFAVNHVAIATGDRLDTGARAANSDSPSRRHRNTDVDSISDGPGITDAHSDELMLHASPVEGTTALWPLRRFREHDRYRRVYAVRRLRERHRSRWR